jgi:hypothetical protein
LRRDEQSHSRSPSYCLSAPAHGSLLQFRSSIRVVQRGEGPPDSESRKRGNCKSTFCFSICVSVVTDHWPCQQKSRAQFIAKTLHMRILQCRKYGVCNPLSLFRTSCGKQPVRWSGSLHGRARSGGVFQEPTARPRQYSRYSPQPGQRCVRREKPGIDPGLAVRNAGQQGPSPDLSRAAVPQCC